MGLFPDRNTFSMRASLSTGSAAVERQELIATISGQYMFGDGDGVPAINISQSTGTVGVNPFRFRFVPFSESARNISLNSQADRAVGTSVYRSGLAPFNFKMRRLTADLDMEARLASAQRISNNQVRLLFNNEITFTGEALNLGGFRLLHGHNELPLTAGVVLRDTITLTSGDLSGLGELAVHYDANIGNLKSALTEKPTETFHYAIRN
jgi:hypothetical protein